jgi:biotin carboxyl carrier protein
VLDHDPAAPAPAGSDPAANVDAGSPSGDSHPASRSASERIADHRAVERLAGELLPTLIARLSASGLAELEVREGPWKVRLRRPLEVTGGGRRAGDRQVRLAGPGAAGGATYGGNPVPMRAAGGSHGSADGGARGASRDGRGEEDPQRPTVNAPAVGIFRPRPGVTGTAVRNGDRLGVVDMLGIPQDVLAPADGLVAEILAEPGDGVEYGQPLFAMRAPATAPGTAAGTAAIPIEAEGQVTARAGERA